MKRNTAKRAKENREYNERVKPFLEEHRFCPVAANMLGSQCRTTQNHHTKGRDGALLLDERFWLAVSDRGHKWIHDNPKEARRYGFVFTKGYGINDQLEARVCERRRMMDFYPVPEYDELMSAILPDYE